MSSFPYREENRYGSNSYTYGRVGEKEKVKKNVSLGQKFMQMNQDRIKLWALDYKRGLVSWVREK